MYESGRPRIYRGEMHRGDVKRQGFIRNAQESGLIYASACPVSMKVVQWICNPQALVRFRHGAPDSTSDGLLLSLNAARYATSASRPKRSVMVSGKQSFKTLAKWLLPTTKQ